MLGLGWVVVYKSTDRQVQEEVNALVKAVATKTQNENTTFSNLAAAYEDENYDSKVAFAIGMTQNQAKMSLNFDGGAELPKQKKIPSFDKKTLAANHVKPDTKGTKTITYFDSALKDTLKKENLDIAYRIQKIRTNKIPPANYASGLFIINFFQPDVYQVVYDKIPTSLFVKKLFPYTGVSLLLLILFTGAFFMFYKSYKMQMHMAQFRESLFSNVTHELKTPLSSLQLIVHSFKEGGNNLTEKQEEYVNFADRELQRMHLLIEKILSVGKLDQAQFALNKEVINLPELIREAIQVMNITAINKNARILFEPQIDCEILGDRVLLLNMLVNIIDNAIKYNKNVPRIRIMLEQENDHIKMLLMDNGIGIQRQYYAKIFEPFFRVPTGNEHSTKGHGLGLSFTQQVVKMHSGKISLESEPGKGSVFTILMPS